MRTSSLGSVSVRDRTQAVCAGLGLKVGYGLGGMN